MRRILRFCGWIFGVINMLPIPWRVRILWYRWIYSILRVRALLPVSDRGWAEALGQPWNPGAGGSR